MNTLIAVPCMDQTPTLFTQSLVLLKKVGEVSCGFQIGSLVYDARNGLGKQALMGDYDYVLWFDSDMVFETDTMERMFKTLQDNKLDILTGLYFRRVPPYSPVLYRTLDYHDSKAIWTEFDELPEKALVEVAGCGFGCVLMSTDVLMSVQGKYNTMFQPMQGMGEDLAFCWRARQCGYKIMCDTSLVVGHCGQAIVNDAYWRSYRRDEK